MLNVREIMPDRYCSIFRPFLDIGPVLLVEQFVVFRRIVALKMQMDEIRFLESPWTTRGTNVTAEDSGEIM